MGIIIAGPEEHIRIVGICPHLIFAYKLSIQQVRGQIRPTAHYVGLSPLKNSPPGCALYSGKFFVDLS